jgi:lysophospholipase L1-like esterase
MSRSKVGMPAQYTRGGSIDTRERRALQFVGSLPSAIVSPGEIMQAFAGAAVRSRAWLIAIMVVVGSPAFGQSKSSDHWVATWATALVVRPVAPAGAPGPGGPPPANGPNAAPANGAPARPRPPPPATLSDQTIRQIVHTSIGGDRVRVVLSNVFGTAPLEIGAGAVALRDGESHLAAGTVKPLTFDGKKAASVLPGAVLVSDPIDMRLAPLADLAIDLYVPGDIGLGSSPATTHNGASQTNYISANGNHVGEPAMTAEKQTGAWFNLARVEVAAPANARAVVAFGDSITDGARSTPDADARWPDELARRLAGQRGGARVAVLNAGISGNQVLGDGAGISALARFDKDVLLQPGVTHVIVMEGINDIGLARSNPTPTAADLIAGHRQLIARAHAHGLKIYGATLTPFEGAAYYTPEGEAKRRALNDWIRTSREYDGVIDFDAVMRDPKAPSKFLPAADSGDHLHPGDAGYKMMGDAVDLGLFK